jgi:prefoldin subunit 5
MHWPTPYREPVYSKEDEIRMLKAQAESLKDDLNYIEGRMNELEAEKKTDE